ncbi:MAG: hypothetical protein IJL92_04100, partial [Thermoguttaceae bacterium]|nr:hypothetical protein [Thermoguttaceae bacterium]
MKRQTSEKRNWKTETLRFEALENRELLSVNPSDAIDLNSYANYASLESGTDAVVDLKITDDAASDSPSLVLASASETASTVVTSLADVVNANDGVVTLREAIT